MRWKRVACSKGVGLVWARAGWKRAVCWARNVVTWRDSRDTVDASQGVLIVNIVGCAAMASLLSLVLAQTNSPPPPVVYGCVDPSASNYNSAAGVYMCPNWQSTQGTPQACCIYAVPPPPSPPPPVYGCMYPGAVNYNPSATVSYESIGQPSNCLMAEPPPSPAPPPPPPPRPPPTPPPPAFPPAVPVGSPQMPPPPPTLPPKPHELSSRTDDAAEAPKNAPRSVAVGERARAPTIGSGGASCRPRAERANITCRRRGE